MYLGSNKQDQYDNYDYNYGNETWQLGANSGMGATAANPFYPDYNATVVKKPVTTQSKMINLTMPKFKFGDAFNNALNLYSQVNNAAYQNKLRKLRLEAMRAQNAAYMQNSVPQVFQGFNNPIGIENAAGGLDASNTDYKDYQTQSQTNYIPYLLAGGALLAVLLLTQKRGK